MLNLRHHFSKLPNCNLVVWIAHIKNLSIGPGRIFLLTSYSSHLVEKQFKDEHLQSDNLPLKSKSII